MGDHGSLERYWERDGIAGVLRRNGAPVSVKQRGEPGAIERAATATLDKLNRGVLLIRSDGGIAFMNRAARVMLDRRDGLVAPGGRLGFQQRSVQARFDAFLVGHADDDGEASLVLVAGGHPERGAYRVLVSPIDVGVGSDNPSYCVFIYEPDAGRLELPKKVLKQLYGLTAGEARLANELFVGKSLQDAAAALSITANTARTKLKRIFSKCAVASQGELLQLLSLGPRTL
jgi:DNA-binding CsgD family transcriptional regulator